MQCLLHTAWTSHVALFAGTIGMIAGGCGGGRVLRPHDEDLPVRPPPLSTGLALVQNLYAVATQVRRGAVEHYVDEEHARRHPSSADLQLLLLSGARHRCIPRFVEHPDVHDFLRASRPPASDPWFDWPTPPELAGAWEVVAECTMRVVAHHCCSPVPLPIYSIVVRRGGDGVIRALAWRELPVDVTLCPGSRPNEP